MKSLEHIIREIREGKAEKGSKKTLEGSIRKVMKGEKESSFADRTTKPITDDVGGLAGSGTGGEPKLHAEAIGVIGTDEYQGNQFKSVRTATPHIKPPAGAGSHSQAPENVSRQRTLAKERSSMTLHGKVTEQAAVAELPKLGLKALPRLGGAALGPLGAMASFAYKAAPYVQKFVEIDPQEVEKAKEKLKTPAGTPEKTKPVNEPEVEASKKAKEKKEKAPSVVEVPVKTPKEFVPQKDGAVVSPPSQAPSGPTVPPPYRTQPQQPAKEKEKTPAETPKRWKEVGPPMPAETRPEVKPAEAPDTKTKPEVKTGVVQLPAIDIGTKTAAKTDVAPATAAKTATDTATTTSEPEEKNRFPLSFGATAMPDIFGAQKGITSKHPSASRARGHRRHVSEEVADEIREKIQNMPRPDAGDRKSIEYVGRKDSDPKSVKQKTSRLATIKNVIDEAKKIKFEAEFGKEKKYVYPNDTEVVIGPNMKRNFLDVEDSKLPKDYENK